MKTLVTVFIITSFTLLNSNGIYAYEYNSINAKESIDDSIVSARPKPMKTKKPANKPTKTSKLKTHSSKVKSKMVNAAKRVGKMAKSKLPKSKNKSRANQKPAHDKKGNNKKKATASTKAEKQKLRESSNEFHRNLKKDDFKSQQGKLNPAFQRAKDREELPITKNSGKQKVDENHLTHDLKKNGIDFYP